MSLKINIVKEVELKTPFIDERIPPSCSKGCLAKSDFINCKGIECTECLFMIDNYKVFKNSEEQL